MHNTLYLHLPADLPAVDADRLFYQSPRGDACDSSAGNANKSRRIQGMLVRIVPDDLSVLYLRALERAQRRAFTSDVNSP